MESDATSATDRRVDFFISHAGRDQVWAEWLAWQLIEAGYTVELDVWDWTPGQDFVARMQDALRRAERLLVVWSEAYFRSPFGGAELRAAFVRQAQAAGRIVPVLVEPATVPDLYASLIYVDLVGLDEAAAAERLRTRLAGQRPAAPPRFPVPRSPPGFAGRPRTRRGWTSQCSPAGSRRCGTCPRGIRTSSAADRCWPSCGPGCAPESTPSRCRRCMGWAAWARPSWRSSTPTGSPADYDLVWWLDAEQPTLLAGQLAALAGPLGLPTGCSVPVAVDHVLAELRSRSRWLLVFDNAQRPQDLVDYLPGGAGHVLVTSRYPGWGGLGGRVEVDVLARAETVALLRRRLPEVDEQLADQLAAELGDLPLAAAQAAGYLESTGVPPATYLRRLRTRRASLLARGDVVGYQGRLDTTWTLSLERLRTDAPAAVQLLQLAAFLAPEPIPLRLFRAHADLLAEPLRTAAADPDDLDDLVGLIVGFSLLRREVDRIRPHRLVQAVIRHQLASADQQRKQERVLTVLLAAHPGDPDDPATWDGYAELAPHLLATSPLADARPDVRRLVLDTAKYLHATGDSRASRGISMELLDRWRQTLGADHPDTLHAASSLAFARLGLGEVEPARTLGQDTVERCRRVLGPDHFVTLYAAAVLTLALAQLGKAEPAHALGQDTVERSRRALGPDHRFTLYAPIALTVALVELGEVEPARALGQDTVERCRRVLGPDHRFTLYAAAVLTLALAQLGKAEPAHALGQDTVERSRRALGPDHFVTLYAAHVTGTAVSGRPPSSGDPSGRS